MTSKSLFFKRIKQDLHQRVWFPVVFFIVAFLTMELPLVSELDRLSAKLNAAEQMREYLVEFFTFLSPFTVITGVAAVFCAISGYSYMHSARKLDTYHSMPIKREQLFWQQYVYGILYYVVPLVIHVVICMLIAAIMGAFSMQALTNIAWFILTQLIVYVLFYAVSITAVCLTGNMVISILACGVLAVYSFILYMLKLELYNTFFDTFYYSAAEQIWAFSPVHLLANLMIDYGAKESTTFVYSDYMWNLSKMLLQAVVYTVIALVLYKKRSTEAAGRSIAFDFVEPIVKTMIVLPVAIVCAYIFRSLVMDDYNYGWYIFGGLFGFIISCLVMEAIFRQNPREVFAHPKQIAINGVIVAAVFIIFRFDVFGYDYYMPTNVTSYGISINSLHYINMYSEDCQEWRLENMEIEPSESVTKLIEQAMEDSDYRTNLYFVDSIVGEDAYYTSIYVKYNLENGKSVHRSYVLNLYNDTTQKLLAEIYNTDEYKVGAYPILSEAWKRDYNYIEVVSAYARDDFQLKEDKMNKLIETYQRELLSLTYEEVWNELPVAELSFERNSDENSYNGYRYENGYRIYDSFTQTIALLEEYGCIMADMIPVDQIISVEVEDYSIENGDTNGIIDKVMEVVYTKEDVEKVTEIMENIVSSELVDSLKPDLCDPLADVRIDFVYNDKEYTRYFEFKINSMPDWLREELDSSLVDKEAYGEVIDGEMAVAVPVYE